MKEFDYYIFIDFSENLIGYNIIEHDKLNALLPKISKFAHYRKLKHKHSYIQSIKKVIEKNNITSYFIKSKIKEIRQNMDIYLDALEFIKKHNNWIIYRVRASVNPTNHIKRGVRQVAFPHMKLDGCKIFKSFACHLPEDMSDI